jgi:serine/threonine protein kinase
MCAEDAVSGCVQVIVDKGYHGATADLWSCGVILFVLMAGYLPFDEPNLLNLYRKVRIFPPTVTPSLYKAFVAVAIALCKNTL